MTTTYTGVLRVSGSSQYGNGDAAIVSGYLGIDVTAGVNGAGNGTVSVSVNGELIAVYAYASGGSRPIQIPLAMAVPSDGVASGAFNLVAQVTTQLLDSPFNVALGGVFAANQGTITASLSASSVSGTGTPGDQGSLAASGTLIAETGPLIVLGTKANQRIGDTGSLNPFNDVIVADPAPGAIVTATATLSGVANGTLANPAVGTFDASTGAYTITGSAGAVSAALEGITFAPTPHQAAAGQTVTTTLTIQVTDSTGGQERDNATTILVTQSAVPTLSAIATFAGADGSGPEGTLVRDPNGNIFGTASASGLFQGGTLFEIAALGASYAASPTVITAFAGANGYEPDAGLIADPGGNLLGTTAQGGANNEGTVFELVRGPGGYASLVSQLVSFDGANGGSPFGGLVLDTGGDLLGTTETGGTAGLGTVFELVRTTNGYAVAPSVLANLNSATGYDPQAALVIDGAGDLFGAGRFGGAFGYGTIFEIAKTAGGYAAAPAVLVNFNNTNGAIPTGLAIDQNGDLFGTTGGGGANSDGTVFELPLIGGAYPGGVVTLASFDGVGGLYPSGGILIDAKGDLFGTTLLGGANGAGTVFEVPAGSVTQTGTPLTVANLPGGDLASPNGGLIADRAGILYGTAYGTNNGGSVFQVSNSGYQPVLRAADDFSGAGVSDVLWQSTGGELAVWNVRGGVALSANDLGALGSGWSVAGTGVFHQSGSTDILFENTNGLIAQWRMAGGIAVSAGIVGMAGAGWNAAGTGDFYGNGVDGVLFRDASGDIAQWRVSDGVAISATLVGTTTSDWSIAAIGKLSGAGADNIVFINRDGLVADWTIVNGEATSAATLGQTSAYWSIVGLGDFTGNGQDDILFRGQGGEIAMWLTQYGQVTSASMIGTTSPDWRIAGIGDYDGNGTDDILFQNPSGGQLAVWELTNGVVTGVANLGMSGPGWQVALVHDGVPLPS